MSFACGFTFCRFLHELDDETAQSDSTRFRDRLCLLIDFIGDVSYVQRRHAIEL